MDPYISRAGGYLTNPNSTTACRFCSFRTTDEFMDLSFNLKYSHRWRDVGFFAAFIAFNVCDHSVSLALFSLTLVSQIALTYLLTYVFRMKRWDQSRLSRWRRKSAPKPQTTPGPKRRETVILTPWAAPHHFVRLNDDQKSEDTSISTFI